VGYLLDVLGVLSGEQVVLPLGSQQQRAAGRGRRRRLPLRCDADAALYDGSKIKVLKGLDAVRKRPGMYIGDTDDGTGLHHMVFEVVDNSIDEALAGHCRRSRSRSIPDESVSVSTTAAAFPRKCTKRASAAEVIMTVLHAGGKFDDNTYKVSGGPARRRRFRRQRACRRNWWLTIWREGKRTSSITATVFPRRRWKHRWTRRQDGHADPLQAVGRDLHQHRVSLRQLAKRLRELAFLNSGVRIVLRDERSGREETYFYEGGLGPSSTT
jgi:DNA gyrase subunit B